MDLARLIAYNPVKQLIEHSLPCAGVAARRVSALLRIVEGCPSDVLLEDLKTVLPSRLS